MISCYVIGDITTIKTLITYIEEFSITTLKGFASPTLNNLEFVLNDPPNILFVEAACISQFKKTLIKIGPHSSIVYIADASSYAFETFETLALDYILKPVTFTSFAGSVNKLVNFSQLATPRNNSHLRINKLSNITDSFFIKSDNKGLKEVLIRCEEVVYIEAIHNEVILHTVDKDFVCYNTLKDMEENLPERYFIRVHKSYIINYDKITSIERNRIILNYNDKVPLQIGNTYKKAFLERKSQKNIVKRLQANYVSYPR